MVRKSALVAVFVVVGSTLGTNASAAPPPIEFPACGATIEHSIRLGANLNCTAAGAPHDGLIVGAAGITVDLNGFRVTGDGTNGAGIRNDVFSNVTVRNGTIRGFGSGAWVSASSNKVTGLSILNISGIGVFISGERNVIDSVFVDTTGANGISVAGSFNVKNNTLTSLGDIGIYARDLPGNDLVSRIERNFVSDTEDTGLYLDDARQIVRGNTVVRAGDGDLAGGLDTDHGIFAPVGRHTIASNEVIDANQNGIDASAGQKVVANIVRGSDRDGITYSSATTGGLIKDNRVSGSAQDGMSITGRQRVIGNRVIDNLFTGIIASGSFLKWNVARGNGVDGIELSGTGGSLIENRTDNNGFFLGFPDGNGFGIYAATAGLRSARGNLARGNDSPTQCNPDALC